jgi:hypothetical protein
VQNDQDMAFILERVIFHYQKKRKGTYESTEVTTNSPEYPFADTAHFPTMLQETHEISTDSAKINFPKFIVAKMSQQTTLFGNAVLWFL